MILHQQQHLKAGRTVRVKLGGVDPQFANQFFTVIDWYDRLSFHSWKNMTGNSMCLQYGMRIGTARMPTDDEVVIGYVGSNKILVHESEFLK